MMSPTLKPRQVNFEDAWSKLLETIRGVISLNRLSFVKQETWNDRFTDIYQIVVAQPEPQGEKLYEHVKLFLQNHVDNLYSEVCRCGEEASLLAAYHRFWVEYRLGATYLDTLFRHLNTNVIRNQKTTEADLHFGMGQSLGLDLSNHMMEIGELCLDTWRRCMVEPLKHVLTKLLLQQIEQDRRGSPVQQTVLHDVIHSLVDVEEYNKNNQLKLYASIFEQPLLDATESFYSCEAEQLLSRHNCSQFMEKVLLRLDEEKLRAHKFVHPSSFVAVMAAFQRATIERHLQLLEAESAAMVDKEERIDLSHLYRLLKPIPEPLKRLVSLMEDHIRQRAVKAVQSVAGEQAAQQFVETVLELHSHYVTLISGVFDGDQLMMAALDRASAHAVNKPRNARGLPMAPEWLCRYCDSLLRKSSRAAGELEEKLGAAITVFKYIDDKDVFQKFYGKLLARRLINSLSVALEAEELFISRLKSVCGYEFTSKFHRMFTDMQVSADRNAEFSKYCRTREIELGISASFLVLQAGAWPISSAPALHSPALPPELERSIQQFETFYCEKFNGRKLTWQLPLSTAEVKLCYTSRSYFVTLSTLQLCLLLAFSSSDTQNMLQLTERSGLDEEELVKQIQALVDVALLLADGDVAAEAPASPRTPENAVAVPLQLTAHSELHLNLEFASKRTKFKVAMAAPKETPQETERTRDNVEEDRKLYLQAAIVRVMKARKVLRHQQLVQEVIEQCQGRFVPKVSAIKKCVEILIDKQYLERSTEANDEYKYVA